MKRNLFVVLVLVAGIFFLVGCESNPNRPNPNPTPTPSGSPLPDPIIVDAPVPANISLDDVKALMASAMGRPTDTGARFACREIVVELHGDGLVMTDRLAEGIRAWGLNPDAPNPACGTLNITVSDQVVAETGGPDFKPDRVTVSVGRVYINPQSVRFGEPLLVHGTGHAAYGLGHSMNDSDSSGGFIMFAGTGVSRLLPNDTERWLADLIWRYAPGTKFNFHR